MVSIVFPVFNEQDNLQVLYQRLSGVVAGIPDQAFEIIFVDDCSTDGTPQLIEELCRRDQRVRSIRFARNCGGHTALTAGLNMAKGDCAITMAADLQDPPELIVQLLAEWSSGYQVVWAARSSRRDVNFIFRFFSKMYYALMNRITSLRMPALGVDVFLADRVAIDAFNDISERNTSIFMTFYWLGFRQKTIFYSKEPRCRGRSNWTFRKRVELLLNSIVSFSLFPIRLISILGFSISAFGFIYGVWVLGGQMFQRQEFSVLHIIIAAIFLMGGLQIAALGIIGEYLWRVYDQVRGRPRYVIESMNPKEP